MPVTGRSSALARGIYVANLIAQSVIVVTGAIVRLTGSGLGCPTWPECVEGSYTPAAHQEQGVHKFIEFGNRTLTFVLVVLAIVAILAAFNDKRRQRAAGVAERPAIIWLAFAPILGTVAQAILGGITVLTQLNPVTVSLHFLVSMAIIAAVVELVVRSGDVGDRPVVALVPAILRWMAWALSAVTAVVVVLGVVTTGSGPHSGDANVEARYGFDPRTVAWLHADAVFLFLGLAAGLLLALYLVKAPARAQRAVIHLLALAVVQGIIGYVQFWTGLPVWLVVLHVIGAVAIWVAVLFIPGMLRTRGVEPEAEASAEPAAAAVASSADEGVDGNSGE